jgi:hypothetical protein
VRSAVFAVGLLAGVALAGCGAPSSGISPTSTPTPSPTAIETPTSTLAPSAAPAPTSPWQTVQGTNGIGRSSYTVSYPNGWAARKGDANDLSVSPDASLLGPGVEQAGIFYFSCGIGSDPAFSVRPVPTPGSSGGTVTTGVTVAGIPGVRFGSATSVGYRFQSPSFACLVDYQIVAGQDLTTTFDEVVRSLNVQR